MKKIQQMELLIPTLKILSGPIHCRLKASLNIIAILFFTCNIIGQESRSFNKIYDRALPLDFHTILIQYKGKYGTLDQHGKILIPANYENFVSKFGKNFVFQMEGKFGVVDSTNKVIIPFIYDGITVFDNDDEHLAVEKDKRLGILNQQGKVIVPTEYTSIGSHKALFFNGLALFQKSNLYGFFNKDGKIIIPAIYTNADDFSEGLAPVKLKNRWVYIDHSGKIKLKPSRKFDSVGRFYNGYASVKIENKEKLFNEKAGLIDRKGKLSVAVNYDNVSYSNGFFVAKISDSAANNSKVILINMVGEVVLSASHDLYFISVKKDSTIEVEKNSTYLKGVYSASGQPVLKPIYRSLKKLVNGDYLVEEHAETYTIFNQKGQIKQLLLYNYIDMAFGTVGAVSREIENASFFGYIDENLKEIIAPMYEDAQSFSSNLGRVKLNDKYGYVDRNNTVAVPIIYDHAAERFEAGYSIVLLGHHRYLINLRGELILELKTLENGRAY